MLDLEQHVQAMAGGSTATGRWWFRAAARIAPGRLEAGRAAHQFHGGGREVAGDQARHALGGGADPGHQVVGLVLARGGLVRLRAQPRHVDVDQRLAQLQPHHAGRAEPGSAWHCHAAAAGWADRR
ncbi:hypothetical protein G6F46_014204 [Rhizopus delemar]|nr:hypothetical protein G6F46_014204 [Rhizopus delemar]